MEKSSLRNGTKGSQLPLDDRSLGRRETEVTEIIPMERGSPGSWDTAAGDENRVQNLVGRTWGAGGSQRWRLADSTKSQATAL